MEGLDLGQTSNPSLAWKNERFKINYDDDVWPHLKNKSGWINTCITFIGS